MTKEYLETLTKRELHKLADNIAVSEAPLDKRAQVLELITSILYPVDTVIEEAVDIGLD